MEIREYNKTTLTDNIDFQINGLGSNTLILQSYLTSVLRQSPIDFLDLMTRHPEKAVELASAQKKVNDALTQSQETANNYINNIYPSIISNIVSLDNFCNLYNIVATKKNPNQTIEQWDQYLNTLIKECNNKSEKAEATSQLLREFNNRLILDHQALDKATKALDKIMDTDEGVIKDFNTLLNKAQTAINIAMAEIVSGAILMPVGGVMIVIGAASTVVTGGAAIGLVAGGVAVLAGGGVLTAIGMKSMSDSINYKSKILSDINTLKAEQIVIRGVSATYHSIKDLNQASQKALEAMIASWIYLQQYLEKTKENVAEGAISLDVIQELYLENANEMLQEVKKSVKHIKDMMTLPGIVMCEQGETLAQKYDSFPKAA